MAVIGGIEMRAAPRYPLLQRCFVHPDGADAAKAWRCIAYNISATGIAVTLPTKPAPGAMLTMQAWGLPRARTLRARVVHTKLVDFFWLTGCELVGRLSDAELRVWQSGPRDWLDKAKP
jgi:hypothetical protein